jgi:hypothetical protein
MSLKLLMDLAVLLVVLGTTAIVLLGWGNIVWRLLGIELPNKPCVISVWLGFCTVLGCIEIIHLFIPIDWRATCGVAVVGLIGQRLRPKVPVESRRDLPENLCTSISFTFRLVGAVRRYPLRAFVVILVVVTWCLRAMETPSMYDSGLYHFGSIRWSNEYPIVPGLGNLHWRLALNQSYFGFLALLNIEPYWGRGYAAGGLFLLLLTALTVLKMSITESRTQRWIFGGVLFPYLFLLSGPIANPLPDTAVALLQITIFIFLYCNLVARKELGQIPSPYLQRLQVIIAFLCLTIVTVKLSGVAFACVSFIVALVWMFKSPQCKLPSKLFIKLTLLLCTFVFVHVARGCLLSGAPFFPNPFLGMWFLPWAVDFGVAHNESQLIYAWAKQPGVGLPSELSDGFGWFGAWVRRLPLMFMVMFVASTGLFLIGILIHRAQKKDIGITNILLCTPIFIGFSFWFFSAPDPRFLGALLTLFLICSLLIFTSPLLDKRGQLVCPYLSPHCTKVLSWLGMLVVLALFVRWSLNGMTYTGWQPPTTVEYVVHSTRSGFKAFVPVEGAQCWSGTLPCTYLLHDSLRSESGFRFPYVGFLWNRFWFSMER